MLVLLTTSELQAESWKAATRERSSDQAGTTATAANLVHKRGSKL